MEHQTYILTAGVYRPPPEYIRDLDARLAALDGRVPMDLYGDFDNTVYPLVSEVGGN